MTTQKHSDVLLLGLGMARAIATFTEFLPGTSPSQHILCRCNCGCRFDWTREASRLREYYDDQGSTRVVESADCPACHRRIEHDRQPLTGPEYDHKQCVFAGLLNHPGER